MGLLGGSPPSPTEKLKKAEQGMAQVKSIMGQMEQLTKEIAQRTAKLEQLKKQLAVIQSQMKK